MAYFTERERDGIEAEMKKKKKGHVMIALAFQ